MVRRWMALLCVMLFWCCVTLTPAVRADDDDYRTHIEFKGKITTLTTAKVKINGKEVEVNIVNGKLPYEIAEMREEKKGVVSHSFRFDGTSASYDKEKKYEYVLKGRAPSVTESVEDKEGKVTIRGTYHTNVYKLK